MSTSAPQPRESRPDPVRALSLLSGGLDSQLAIRVLQKQGVEVAAVVFRSVFFDSKAAEEAALSLDVPMIAEDFTDTMFSILQKPKYGFGEHMNPCIDCHIAMLRRAGQIMEERGFHFISTGEVLRQRPMSQNRKALELIASECGYGEYVIRPLSAKLLPPTAPELRGWVDRNRLLDLQGRGRKPQIALAGQLKISSYPQPAGGCILTDPRYSARMKDLLAHEGLAQAKLVGLLRAGRHFRIGDTKLIVGRNENENKILEQAARGGHVLLKSESVPGPTALLAGMPEEPGLVLAASVCARYVDCPPARAADITVFSSNGKRTVSVFPAEEMTIRSLIV